MKEKSCKIELSHSWENLKLIISDPGRTLKFFPYFKDIRGDVVRFEVPRWLFKFGYEFRLSIAFKENGASYVFTGDKGILTVEFTMRGRELEVRAMWSGFGEMLMGGPLERFACGIAKAIKEFCDSQKACPIVTPKNVVENITPETAPALIKMILWETGGRDFTLRGVADDGTVIEAKVKNRKLVELRVKEKNGKESVLEATVPVLELTPDLFQDLPLNKKFSLEIEVT